MKQLNRIKRIAESHVEADVSMEHDEDWGHLVRVSSKSEIPLETLDTICDEAGTAMKVEGLKKGEYVYLLR